MKVSKHAIMRMRERSTFYKDGKSVFRKALYNGKSINDIKDDDIKNYLASKKRYNCKIKLYRDYVFIYSKHSKQLYTMYKLPKEMQNREIYKKQKIILTK